jgi:replicative DNA helicase
MIRIGGQLVQEAYEDSTDVFQLMDDHEGEYQKITLQKTGNTITDLNGELVTRFKRLVELQKRDNHITGIPSGFYSLDLITHGWQNTDLIILAARPAVGKTAFALNLARNATRCKLDDGNKINIGFFSLEMSKGQLVDRIIAAESETWLDKIMTGKMEEANLKNIYRDGIQPLSAAGIYIDDTAGLNIYQLRSKARYMIRKFSVNMIIIDYLQLMSGVEDRRINNREQEISNISRNLKVLAKELNIPIMALSQLSRNVEQRKGDSKTPVLSDLRDSGAIEQDADMVMFMYRPEYYNVVTDGLGESTAGLTEISIAKHRNGSLAQGTEAIKLRANLSIQKFYPWEMMDQVRTDLFTKGFKPITKNDRGDDISFE